MKAIQVATFLTSLALLSSEPELRAQDGPSADVNGFFGAFTTSVPIAVPKYHGLEPNLSLAYRSGGRNGWLGVGWALQGLSFIERAQSGGGVPQGGATDVFFLDGVELVPHVALGGTHATKIMNYAKIVHDASNDRWLVYGTNGTLATYTNVFGSIAPVFRWMLRSVADRRGNVVTYNYLLDGIYSAPDHLYLDNITYNQCVIRFNSETGLQPRVDPISYPRGGAGMGVMRQLLGAIEVRVGGQLARAYDLQYTTSTVTGRSLLTNVAQFDRNATVAGGVVTGTSLPAMTMSYETPPTGLLQLPSANQTNWGSDLRTWAADFNGDGRADMASAVGNGVYLKLWDPTTLQFGNSYVSLPFNLGGFASEWIWVGDFTGDGKADIVARDTPTNTRVFASHGGGFIEHNWSTPNLWGPASETWFGDFNGDYKIDIASRGSGFVHVYLSTGSSFTYQSWNTGSWGNMSLTRVGDFDGDGRSDIASPDLTTQPPMIHMKLSSGSNFVTQAWPASGTNIWGGTGFTRAGDFNGDGLTDFLTIRNEFVPANIHVFYSTGSGAFQAHMYGAGINFEHTGPATWTGDFNGDGTTDIMTRADLTSQRHYLFFRQKGQTPTLSSVLDTNPWGHRAYCRVADFNGDGRTDIASPNNPVINLRYSTGEPADYLATLDNGTGSASHLEYWPSTRYPNYYLPPGLLMHTVHELVVWVSGAPIATTVYGYQGGRWSLTEKIFLGFETVTSLLSQTGTTVVTTYLQQEGSISKPLSTKYVDAQQAKYAENSFVYSYNATPPYKSTLTTRHEDTYNLTTSMRRVSTQYGYDIYGNVIATIEHGDVAVNGDERLTMRSYTPNGIDYIVGLPAYEIAYEGTTASAPVLDVKLYYYDGATSFAVPPARGDLTKLEKYLNTNNTLVAVFMTYDAWGNMTQETNENGAVTVTGYDPTYHVFPESVTNAMLHTSTRTWDYVLGLELTNTDPNLAVRATTYDGFGRVSTVTYPNGAVATKQYLNWSSPSLRHILETEPDGTANGLWKETYLDALGRTYKVVREGGVRVDTEYWHSTNRIKRKSLPYKAPETPRYTQYFVDGGGRPYVTVNPDNSFTEVRYLMDVYSKPYEQHRNSLGQLSYVWYNANGKISRMTEVLGAQQFHTSYVYDGRERLVRVTDSSNNASTFVYDTLGRKVQSTDPDMGHWTYTYDAAGNQLTQTDARGVTITWTYDAVGRMRTRTYPGGAVFEWRYDEAGRGASIGRVTTRLHQHGLDAFAYDARGLVTADARMLYGIIRMSTTTYDTMGRKQTVTYPLGDMVTYGYDNEGRVASASGLINNITYASSDQILAIDHANGVRHEYTYDPDRLWMTGSTVRLGTSTLYDNIFGRDVGARINSMASTTNVSRNVAFWYDDLNRLTSVSGAQNQAFTYDNIGNMLTKTGVGPYVYGGPVAHAPSTINGVACTYDANGNLLQFGNRGFAWDSDNTLTSVADPSGTTQYGYDSHGARVFVVSSAGAEGFFADFASELNGVVTQYYHVGGMRVAKQTGSTRVTYHHDQLGSPVLVTDANGAVVRSLDYDPYGQIISSAGTHSDPFAFNGHREDDNGLVYMKARYYDPQLGRFIQPDPLVPDAGNPQALNRYAFAYNNPVDNTDPSGHAPIAAAVIAATLITASSTTAIAVTAWVGVGLTVAGYYAKDPYLSTAGAVLLGFAGGYAGAGAASKLSAVGQGLLGASGAVLSSPLSPLDRDARVAVGWAFTVLGHTKSYESLDGLTANALDTAMKTGARMGMSKVLQHYDIDEGYFVVGLTVASFVGNLTCGSRLERGGGPYNNGLSRNGGPVMHGMTMRPDLLAKGGNWRYASLPFDIVDVVIGYQGLPTASAYNYMFSNMTGLPLTGHSLGAIDANNLAGWGISGETRTMALPFGNSAVGGVTGTNGTWDIISGGPLSSFTNPFLTMRDTGALGHSEYLFR